MTINNKKARWWDRLTRFLHRKVTIQHLAPSGEDTLPPKDIRLQVYLAWVDVWLSVPRPEDATQAPSLSLGEMAQLFKDENLPHLLKPDKLKEVARAFRQHSIQGRMTMGGTIPPSCLEIDVLSERYDPRIECDCKGVVFGDKKVTDDLSLWQDSRCQAVRRMVTVAQTVIDKKEEWYSQGIFTTQRLATAVVELILSSHHLESIPDTCQGSGITNPIPEIRAPDRRPNDRCDSDPTVYGSLFQTPEKIKFCADAKYFFAIACGGSLCNEGLTRAIADTGNDILIGDYSEAANEETLVILQKGGAAAVAFLKLCTLAGVMTAFQFDNLVALIIHFRVLSYYRDHARPSLAGGLYGSHYTGLIGHRYIDIGIWVGVMSASLATGEEITEAKYARLIEVCTWINDLVDLRGDTMRRQRENPVLRGVRGRLCEYLDSCISQCLMLACEAIETAKLSGLVLLGFCNWAVMSSHHKVYELVNGVQEVKRYPPCKYNLIKHKEQYGQLLKALERYGTLGIEAPHVLVTRATMDQLYHVKRAKPDTHLAWMADITRSLLEPTTLRKIIDVVHFEWKGDIGDEEFCP